MSGTPTLDQINAWFQQVVRDSVAAGSASQPSRVYRLWRRGDTGTCMVLRDLQELEGGELLFGPDTFEECMRKARELPSKVRL